MRSITSTISNYSLGLILCIVYSSTFTKVGFSQCPTAPLTESSQSCSGGSGILTNNAGLWSSSTKYWWNSGSATVNNVSFGADNSLLVVCGGNLTINNPNFWGGTILVKTGATLNFTTSAGSFDLTQKTIIINYGTVNFNKDVNMSGNPVEFYNMANGVMNFSGALRMNLNNSYILNQNVINTASFEVNTPTMSLCQGLNAFFNVSGNFTNTGISNTFQSPYGNSCFFVGGNITMNQVGGITNQSAFHVCDATGGTQSGIGTWGSATVTLNCTECLISLPVELVAFSGTYNENSVDLNWETETSDVVDYFIIDKSMDGVNWEEVGTVENQSEYTYSTYSLTDFLPLRSITYYRLKLVDYNGVTIESSVISVKTDDGNQPVIFPNPASKQFSISYSKAIAEISIYDIQGKLLIQADHSAIMNISDLSEGIYTVCVRELSGTSKTLKLIVQ